MTALSPKIKEKNAAKWLPSLREALLPSEDVLAIFGRGRMKPVTTAIAVTNARLIAFYAADSRRDRRIPIAAFGDQIQSYELRERLGNITLLANVSGTETSFGTIDKSETEFARYYVELVMSSGIPSGVQAGIQLQREAEVAAVEAHEEHLRDRANVEVIGSAMKDKWWEAAGRHAHADELPWLVINCGMDGRLFAFEDRLVISKTGGMTSLMAGATGGGRETVFPFTDITNIEYNSGFVNGVLEILTPSYQGTANHDFWTSGTNSGKNPRELSNCLPLPKALYQQAQPRINELQHKVAQAKRPQVIVQHSAPSSHEGLASELSKLADMHQQGLLDDAEFKAAKQATIAKLT